MGVMRAVDPDFALHRGDARQPRRRLDGRERMGAGFLGERRPPMRHRNNGEAGIVDLMRPVHRGLWQIEEARFGLHHEAPALCKRVPVTPLDQKRRADLLGALGNHVRNNALLARDDRLRARSQYARLVARDRREIVAKRADMIKIDGRDHAQGRRLDDICRVE